MDPPLLPVDPVSRAQLRLVHHRILKDWYSLARSIEDASGRKADQLAKQLKESLLAANELFKMSEYLLSDELSLVDCTLGPLLWRLPHYGVKLGKPGVAVETYAHRIFSRSSFKASLTQAERDLLFLVLYESPQATHQGMRLRTGDYSPPEGLVIPCHE